MTTQQANDLRETTRVYCAMKRAQATAMRMEAEFEVAVARLDGDALEVFGRTERQLANRDWEAQ